MRSERRAQLLKFALWGIGIVLFVAFLAYSSTGKPATTQRDFVLTKQWGLVKRELIQSASNRRGLRHLPRKIIFETDDDGIEAYLLKMPGLGSKEFVPRMMSVTDDLAAGRPPQGADVIRQGKIQQGTVWQIHRWPWAISHPQYLLLVSSAKDAELRVRVSYGRD